ncbi:MAG TPA: zf-HC2 domain-containing protein [Candidatus Binatia bacterium]|jgi:hypothetical protein
MAERKELPPGACKDFEPDLVLYYYQDCAGAERQRVELHLESCARCRTFLEGLRSFLPATVEADEPAPAFWQSYSREMRAKLAAEDEKAGWRQALSFLFRPWPVPAMATALILVLALTFTKGWLPTGQNAKEPELAEMAENVDFLNSMDFLDSMALLEAVEGQETQSGETTPRSL